MKTASNLWKRARRIGIAAATTLTIASVAVAAQTPVTKPNLITGDRWVVRTIDLHSQEETQAYEHRVTNLSGSTIEIDRTILSSKTSSAVGRPAKRRADVDTWTFVNSAIIEGRYIAFDFPIYPGKSWEYQYRTKTNRGETANKRTATVHEWEDVRVPAGSFRALKVVHKGTYSRHAPDGRVYGGNITETFWYAPDAKWWVKREFEDLWSSQWGELQPWTRTRNEVTTLELKR